MGCWQLFACAPAIDVDSGARLVVGDVRRWAPKEVVSSERTLHGRIFSMFRNGPKLVNGLF